MVDRIVPVGEALSVVCSGMANKLSAFCHAG